jgi:hypothetical protein
MLYPYRLCLFDFASCSYHAINIENFLLHGLLSIDDNYITLTTDDIIIYNIDPFSPLHIIIPPRSHLKNRSLAIVCDTHHGELPLTRILQFCLNQRVSHINLRFNQRHSVFFSSFGIKVYNTLFSPDLSLYISNVDYTKRFSPHSVRHPRVLHCGSLSRQHLYRNSCVQFLTKNSTLLNRRFPNASSMLDNFFNFRTILNVSLNLDFNRRIIEAGICGCHLITDVLEDTQWLHPFNLFKPFISFFSTRDQLLYLIQNSHTVSINSDFTKLLLHFSHIRFDYNLRSQMLLSISNYSFQSTPSNFESILCDVHNYDLLQESIRKGTIFSEYHFFNDLSASINSDFSHSFTSLLLQGLRRWRNYA